MPKRKKEKISYVDKSNLVKESNVLARAQLEPVAESVWEERIIAKIVSFNRVDSTEFPEQPFMIAQLVDGRKHLDGRTLMAISNACSRLASTKFRVQFSRNHFRIYSVFDYIEYDNGIISARLNQSLKSHYLQLKREFTMYSLPEFKQLSSVHGQQLFRFLASLRGLEDTTVPIEQLHFITAASDTLRSNFKDFRRRILEPAEKEINAKTSLKFCWEPIKTGRKVTAIRFVFASAMEEAPLAAMEAEKEDLAKWQRLSNACWERHNKMGLKCKPNHGRKCTYCRTRGRMCASDLALPENLRKEDSTG